MNRTAEEHEGRRRRPQPLYTASLEVSGPQSLDSLISGSGSALREVLLLLLQPPSCAGQRGHRQKGTDPALLALRASREGGHGELRPDSGTGDIGQWAALEVR